MMPVDNITILIFFKCAKKAALHIMMPFNNEFMRHSRGRINE
jgi:hypothetical protein